MANVLKLGFKDNPTIGTDDAIDLISAGSITGYFLKPGMSYGNAQLDKATNRLVRTLTLPLEVRGTTLDDAIAKLRALYRYIEQTEIYFSRFGGNIPARSDGAWHQGNAAVLSEQGSNASKMVYWNVLGGDVAVTGPLEDTTMTNFAYQVTVTLIVEAASRGDRVKLQNLVACGDFALPFSVTDTAFNCGWTFPNTTDWTISSTFAKYGLYSLKWSAAGSTTTTTNSPTSTTNNVLSQGDVLLPSLWIRGQVTGGSLTVKMQIWNGSTWADQQTITTSSISNTAWTQYVGTPYTVASGIKQARLSIASPTGGTLYFDGMAIWVNPTGSAVPTEYFTESLQTGNPLIHIYDIQGDTTAPLQIKYSAIDTGMGFANKVIMYGGQVYDPAVDYPFGPMDIRMANSTPDTGVFWGKLALDSTGAATSSNYIQASAFPTLDFRPRKYRLFIEYAANDSAGITKVQVKVGTQTFTYNYSLPQTYVGTTASAASNYRLYDLGDLFYGSPGNAAIDNSLASGVSVTLTHSNNANRHTAVGGLIFIPTDYFSFLECGTGSNGSNIYYGGLTAENGTGAAYALAGWDATSSDYPAARPLEAYENTAFYSASECKLVPGKMRWCFFALYARDSTYSDMYTFLMAQQQRTIFSYSPRYTLGAR